MSALSRPSRSLPFSLPFLLLAGLLAIILITGGASRADVLGQPIVRGAAAAALIAAVFLAPADTARTMRMPLALLGLAMALALLQLIPLPPAWWSALTGHAPLRQAVTGDQPWRPWSIQPGATLNAAMSLLVPLAVLLLATAIRRTERALILLVVLVLISASALLGLVQFAGSPFNSPFVNDSPGDASAFFANRNHFALFLALGCFLAPVWGTWNSRRATWRAPLAIGLVVLFLLLILASGSRAGVALGLLGTGIGLGMARQLVRHQHWRLPRWAEPLAGAAIVLVGAGFVLISLLSGRAQSIDRLMSVDTAADMRTRALPTLTEAIMAYFPVGAGFGSFDTVFRMREPFALLKPTYFNHAHNDYLEVLIDGGLPALVLLLLALGWWAMASVRVWRQEASSPMMLGRIGSVLVLLILIASLFDYPARTATVMAIVAIAAAWLAWGAAAQPALPPSKPDL